LKYFKFAIFCKGPGVFKAEKLQNKKNLNERMGIESNNNSHELFKWILKGKLPFLKQFLKQKLLQHAMMLMNVCWF
jgi:hypothetical protein